MYARTRVQDWFITVNMASKKIMWPLILCFQTFSHNCTAVLSPRFLIFIDNFHFLTLTRSISGVSLNSFDYNRLIFSFLLVYFRDKINLQKKKLKSVLINEIQFCVRLLKCYIHQDQFLYFKISVKIWTINNALGQEQVCRSIIMLSCVLNFHLLLPLIHNHWKRPITMHWLPRYLLEILADLLVNWWSAVTRLIKYCWFTTLQFIRTAI